MSSPSRNFLGLIAAWASVNTRQNNRRSGIQQGKEVITYVDESGDLGMGNGGSKYFVLSMIETASRYNVTNAIRRVKMNRKLPLMQEVKTGCAINGTRASILRKLATLEIHIRSLIVKKDTIPEIMLADTNYLYNYLVCQLLEGCLSYQGTAVINLDKRTTNRSLNDYLEYRFRYERRQDIDIRLTHLDSRRCYGIQAVDVVANATLRLYEHDDCRLYDIIADKVVRNDRLFV